MLTYSYLCHNLRTSYVIYALNSKLTFQITMEKGLLRMMIILMIMLLCCHSKCGKIYLISMIDFLLRMLLFAKVCYWFKDSKICICFCRFLSRHNISFTLVLLPYAWITKMKKGWIHRLVDYYGRTPVY